MSGAAARDGAHRESRRAGQTTAGAAVETSSVVLSEDRWPLLEALFQRVFGQTLERELTRWKYGGGRGLAVAVVESGASGERAVAHCGLMWRDILRFGRPARAAQLVDLMVDPGSRGALVRASSPFARVIAATYRELDREGDARRPFAFGFPSDRAMRLGERLRTFCEVDHIVEYEWPAAAGALPERVTADTAPGISRRLDRLWRGMRAELSRSIVGDRRAGYFIQRYLHHPTRRYEVYLVRSRWLGVARAVFVLRRHADRRVELCDWVARRADVAAMIGAARAAAAADGAGSLFAWITHSHRHWLEGTGDASSKLLEFRIMCRADIPPDEIERCRGRWWLTAGDTDYH